MAVNFADEMIDARRSHLGLDLHSDINIDDMKPTEEDIIEEQRHLQNVITTFQQYGPYAVSA